MGTTSLKKVLFAATLAATTMVGNAYASTASIAYGTTELTVVTPRTTFTDYYNLTLTGTSSFSAYVNEIEKEVTFIDSVGGFNTYNIYNINNTSFKFGLYNAANTLVTDTSSLAAGTYQFRVEGTATGALGGQYFVSMNVASVTAVPEPETNALMLLGMGVIGFVARRKFA